MEKYKETEKKSIYLNFRLLRDSGKNNSLIDTF
jgi:hypothetical protein